MIAWQAARLAAGFLAGETQRPVYEQFPFWTQEEQDALRLAHYRAMMDTLAAGGKTQHKAQEGEAS